MEFWSGTPAGCCRLLGQWRGTQRYMPTQRNDEDALTRAIIELASRYGRYGYRRVTALLKAAGWSSRSCIRKIRSRRLRAGRPDSVFIGHTLQERCTLYYFEANGESLGRLTPAGMKTHFLRLFFRFAFSAARHCNHDRTRASMQR